MTILMDHKTWMQYCFLAESSNLSVLHTQQDFDEIIRDYPLRMLNGPRQANLCLRVFRHDKIFTVHAQPSRGPGIWLSV